MANDIERLVNDLRTLPGVIAAAQKKAVSVGARFIEAQMVKEVPVREGGLKRSIEIKQQENGATIGPTVPYAHWVEFGTRAHKITPKHGKALRFQVGSFGAGGKVYHGETIFARKVSHPGTKANPFRQRTFDQNKDQVTRAAFNVIWSEVRKHLAQ